jgi:3'-5' exoribonuclease
MNTIPAGSPDAHLWVKDIKGEGPVRGLYLAKEKRLGTTRKGEPFLSLVLSDRTGEIEARVWERARDLGALFREGEVICVEGTSSSYRDQIQVTISSLKAVEEPADPHLFLEVSPRDPAEMMGELRELLKGLRNKHLKGLVDRFLADPVFLDLFRSAPAAKNFHHSYLGGLLDHTLSVCRMAELVSARYPYLDGDLLLTGAFLHDIGKTRELRFRFQIDYTDEGRLLGHVVLGAVMLEEKLLHLKGFPQELAVKLKHLILSHHGEYTFGSPKRPKFVEAFALNLIDDLDAKIQGIRQYMDRDRRSGAWTDFNRLFERFFLKGQLQAEERPSQGSEEDRGGQRTLF